MAAFDVRNSEAALHLHSYRAEETGEKFTERGVGGGRRTEAHRENTTFQPGRNTHSNSVISIADVSDRKCERGSGIQG